MPARRLATVCLLALAPCSPGGHAPDPTSSAGAPDARATNDSAEREPYSALLRACLPTCIASFFDECPLDGACTSETASGVTRFCFASGVRARVEERAGGALVTTVTKADGRTACVRKIAEGVDFVFEQLLDGRTARLSVVSDELRTAFCADDSYSDVYRLPRCAALEDLPCAPGPCPP